MLSFEMLKQFQTNLLHSSLWVLYYTFSLFLS